MRIQYKIKDAEFFERKNHSIEDVVRVKLKQKGCGYIHWVLKSLVEYYQCETTFVGKLNKNDTEFCIYRLY